MTEPVSGRRYYVREILGRGGYGTVYRAELVTEGGFAKVVALKVLHTARESTPGELERLKDEARMLGLVRHRALVSADALVRLDGRWTFVMEYLPGASMEEIIHQSGPVPVPVALMAVAEVASALQAVYVAEVDGRPLKMLHRDIKPSNLQITDSGEVKVLDFGVARAEFDGREAHSRRVVYGSIPYMSPERLELVDTAAGDIFALGASLAEMLTGQRPDPAVARPRPHQERVDKLIRGSELASHDQQVAQLVADMVAYEPEDRLDAAAVEARCEALLKRYREPTLRDWAREALPKVLALRSRTTGELSGLSLSEGLAADDPPDLAAMGGAARTWDPERPAKVEKAEPPPPPPPPPKPEPPPPVASTHPTPVIVHPAPSSDGTMGCVGRVLTSLIVSLGAVGVSVVALVALGFLAVFLSCGAMWPWMSKDICKSTIDDIDHALGAARETGSVKQARQLTNQLIQSCETRQMGMMDAIGLETMVEDALRDGSWDPSDQRMFERRANQHIPSGGS